MTLSVIRVLLNPSEGRKMIIDFLQKKPLRTNKLSEVNILRSKITKDIPYKI